LGASGGWQAVIAEPAQMNCRSQPAIAASPRCGPFQARSRPGGEAHDL